MEMEMEKTEEEEKEEEEEGRRPGGGESTVIVKAIPPIVRSRRHRFIVEHIPRHSRTPQQPETEHKKRGTRRERGGDSKDVTDTQKERRGEGQGG